MTAYALFIRMETFQQPELDTYAQKVGDSLAGVPVSMLAAYGELEVLEGETPEGVVLVSFPTMQDARSWYYSEAYQAALKHRLRGARYLSFLVEGDGK